MTFIYLGLFCVKKSRFFFLSYLGCSGFHLNFLGYNSSSQSSSPISLYQAQFLISYFFLEVFSPKPILPSSISKNPFLACSFLQEPISPSIISPQSICSLRSSPHYSNLPAPDPNPHFLQLIISFRTKNGHQSSKFWIISC